MTQDIERRHPGRYEHLRPAAERKRRAEVASREMLRRRAREHRDELDAAIDAQVAAEAEPVPEQEQSLTRTDVEKILSEGKAVTLPAPPLPKFAGIVADELTQRRAERGLAPAKRKFPTSEAAVRSRARLEEAVRNIEHVRTLEAAPGSLVA